MTMSYLGFFFTGIHPAEERILLVVNNSRRLSSDFSGRFACQSYANWRHLHRRQHLEHRLEHRLEPPRRPRLGNR